MKRTLFLSLLIPLWAVVLLAGLGTYIVGKNATRLAQELSIRITRQMDGGSLSTESVGLRFSPGPALEFKDVVIRTGEGISVFAPSFVASPNWFHLLTGSVTLSSLSLKEPVLIYEVGAHASSVDGGININLPEQFSELKLTVHNGQIQVIRTDGTQKRPLCTLSGLDGSVRLPELDKASPESGTGELALKAESLKLYGNDREVSLETRPDRKTETLPAFTLSHPALHLENVRLATDEHPEFRMRAILSADAPLSTSDGTTGRFTCTANLMQRDASLSLEGEFTFKDTLLLDGHPLPADIRIPFSTELNLPEFPESVQIANARLVLAEDEATLNGKLHAEPADSSFSPVLTGRMDVTRFSLPRWFDFAKELPSGLRHALENLCGTFDLTLTPDSFHMQNARLTLSDMSFSGEGSVNRFEKPVVRFDLQTETLRLDSLLAFPNAAPESQAGPLASSEQSIQATGTDTTSPDYSVRLRAQKVSFQSLAGKNLLLTISPKEDMPHLELELGDLLGGRGTGSLTFGESLHMVLSLSSLSLEKLFVTPGQPATWRGRLTADATLDAAGDTAADILSSIRGKLSARIDKGSCLLSDKKTRQDFKRLAFSFQGGGQKGKTPSSIVYMGKWTGEMDTGAVRFTAEAEGPVRFELDKGVQAAATGLKNHLSGSLNGFVWDLSSVLGFDTRKKTLELTDIRGQAKGSSLTGAVRGSDLGTSPKWEGNATLTSTDFRKILDALSLLPAGMPASSLNTFSASTRFVMTGENLVINHLGGMLDKTSFSGELERKPGSTRPQWTFGLTFGTLDIDQYLPQGSTGTTPLRLNDMLLAQDAQGKMTFQNLILAQIPHKELAVPVTLKNGILTADPITASVAGGKAGAGFRAEAKGDGAFVRLRYTLTGCDMYTLSLARHQVDLVSGTGNLDADASGHVRTSADIPKALSGTWKFSITNGGLGKDFRFNHLGASGKLASGILSSKDMALKGPKFSVQGHGWVNLIKKTLDYNLVVSGSGIPDIPVRYYGSLSDPQRSISASGIILGTLSGLFNGTLDVLDTIISAPLRYLKPSRGL